MIMFFLYFDFFISDKSFYFSLLNWFNFISLVLVLYILHYFLYNKVALLKFIYKAISIILIIKNIYV